MHVCHVREKCYTVKEEMKFVTSMGATALDSVKFVQYSPACFSYWNIIFFIIFILDEPRSNGEQQVGKECFHLTEA